MLEKKCPHCHMVVQSMPDRCPFCSGVIVWSTSDISANHMVGKWFAVAGVFFMPYFIYSSNLYDKDLFESILIGVPVGAIVGYLLPIILASGSKG
jgi:hypothetical protein